MLVFTALSSERADAQCDIATEPSALQYTNDVRPSIGEVNVPTNTWIFIGGTHVALNDIPAHADGGSEDFASLPPEDDVLKTVRIEDAGGNERLFQTTWLLGSAFHDTLQQRGYMVLIPRGGLEANEGYTVYAGDNPVSTFTTGTGPDDAAPAAPTLDLTITQTLEPNCDGLGCTTPGELSAVADFSDGLLLILEDTQDTADEVLEALFVEGGVDAFVLGAYQQETFTLTSYTQSTGSSDPTVAYKAVVLDRSGNFSEVTRVEIDTGGDICVGPFSSGGCSAQHREHHNIWPGFGLLMVSIGAFSRRRRR